MKNHLTSYAGKTVFVGLDVHKKTYSLTAIVESSVVFKLTLNADYEELYNILHKRFATAEKIHCAYEAGFSGFGLHRFLESKGITCWVINASSIHVAVNDRVKTDLRDSRKIAEELSCGRIQSIYIPSKEEEVKRQITRRRGQIVKMRAQTSQQIKSFLIFSGLWTGGDEKPISGRYLKKIQERVRGSSDFEFVINSFVIQWENFTKQLLEFRKFLQKQGDEEKHIQEIYESSPGVGLISARILANELGDLSRFKNEKKLFSYTGLTPCEYSSGERVRRGHISRQGPGRIRALLIEIAWRAVASDYGVRENYENLRKRIGGKKAIVAVARKLIGRIRACFRTQTKFQLSGVTLAGRS